MVVYADILVLVNMYIDYFILVLVRRFFHLKTKPVRMFLACAAGGISGLLALLPVGNPVQWLLLSLSAAIICLLAFFDGSYWLWIRTAAAFFTFSLIFSGIILLLVELFGINAMVIAGRVYFPLPPLLLLVFTVLAYIVSVLISYIQGRHEDLPSLNYAVIESEGRTSEVLMKTDTGNSLKEPFSGLPAVVVELEAVRDTVPDCVTGYLQGKGPGSGLRLIPCSTLSGEGLLPAFKPDKFYLKNSSNELDCYIAVTQKRLSSSPWHGLLNPELL